MQQSGPLLAHAVALLQQQLTSQRNGAPLRLWEVLEHSLRSSTCGNPWVGGSVDSAGPTPCEHKAASSALADVESQTEAKSLKSAMWNCTVSTESTPPCEHLVAVLVQISEEVFKYFPTLSLPLIASKDKKLQTITDSGHEQRERFFGEIRFDEHAYAAAVGSKPAIVEVKTQNEKQKKNALAVSYTVAYRAEYRTARLRQMHLGVEVWKLVRATKTMGYSLRYKLTASSQIWDTVASTPLPSITPPVATQLGSSTGRSRSLSLHRFPFDDAAFANLGPKSWKDAVQSHPQWVQKALLSHDLFETNVMRVDTTSEHARFLITPAAAVDDVVNLIEASLLVSFVQRTGTQKAGLMDTTSTSQTLSSPPNDEAVAHTKEPDAASSGSTPNETKKESAHAFSHSSDVGNDMSTASSASTRDTISPPATTISAFAASVSLPTTTPPNRKHKAVSPVQSHPALVRKYCALWRTKAPASKYKSAAPVEKQREGCGTTGEDCKAKMTIQFFTETESTGTANVDVAVVNFCGPACHSHSLDCQHIVVATRRLDARVEAKAAEMCVYERSFKSFRTALNTWVREVLLREISQREGIQRWDIRFFPSDKTLRNVWNRLRAEKQHQKLDQDRAEDVIIKAKANGQVGKEDVVFFQKYKQVHHTYTHS